ncbi:restriction endonuclease subunit S [Ferrovum myxofaciens]|nr:restriction endonuclease subunit S [Ferrovum myxofaciens]
MKGLGISIKQFSKLSNIIDDTLRFDAEHYQIKYEQIDEAITKNNHCVLRELLAMPVITGHTPSMKIERFYGGEIRFVKTDNLRENKIVDVFTDYLTVEGNEEIINSALKADDVIVTVIGATFDVVGRSAIIRKSHLPANINQNIALIRLDKTKINPTYFNAYLNTKYGRGSLHHHSRQTEQVNLNCREVERVLVPLFNQLEAGIESLSTKADIVAEQATTVYAQAETMLLDTLSMANLSPSTEKINIKSFKDSFAATGRLDAEYYQPKYEDCQAHVLAYPNGWQSLMQACNLNDENFSPDDSTVYKYIELADIDDFGGIVGCTEAPGNELPSRARRIVKAGDVLISSIEGSLSSCAIIQEKMDAALCSTGFYVINSDKINAETLLVLFKSALMQNILKQACSGTILTAINKSEFLNIPVPLIELVVQKKITSLVQESFSLKDESERLLVVAKRAVEIAIEHDENAALTYIKTKTLSVVQVESTEHD